MKNRTYFLATPLGRLAVVVALSVTASAVVAQPPRGERKAVRAARAGKVPKPKVIKMASPNKDSRGGADIDTIVMHHTAGGGTAQDVGRHFQDPKAEVSSHYIVDKKGTIVQPVEDKERSWHAGKSVFKGRKDVNDFSIGIEMVNRGDNKDPFTDDQYEALGRLVAYLQSAYGIRAGNITGHKDIALPKGRKTDPAENFSYQRMFKEVEKARRAAADPKR